ncbi:Salicylate hydroxylase [Cyphellophora attinorum]|uniref:Salicylate hydroxylase n=1 Tax=Cyphellophora attinorum TaxID=1664694 RepID=A0A0N1HTV1_9EURO|nr:Salicylate hydroxylase [Phialophora attinorum]KPI42600.1 Salicylate hydroxylase [Phialophora attinorum]
MPQKDFHVAIIGGGIAGLTLAIALAHRNIPFTIYEQAPAFGEIGAGVSFTRNAIESMDICHPDIRAAYDKVKTVNAWPSKQKVWFDYIDGTKSSKAGERQDAEFVISSELGQNGVHRAHFLDELVKVLPEAKEMAVFGKRLLSIDEPSSPDGKLTMRFEDGTTAEADAVVGCDGIKSRVRAAMYGLDSPIAKPVYTHKYAYRALVPIDQAVAVLGEERAKNACMHMGPGAHVLTFLVQHGEFMNVVAFKTNSDDWPEYHRLTRQAKREDALRDFSDFGQSIRSLLELSKDDIDCWAIFDLHDHPVPSMNKGRILIAGDAAHATSPHKGSGAGLAIEDSAVLAELLADDRVQSVRDVEAAFDTFNEVRKERGQWLVNASRRAGDLYEWRAEGVGKDFAAIKKEIDESNAVISSASVRQMVEEAQEVLARRLGTKQRL